jgi:hypothetical protein
MPNMNREPKVYKCEEEILKDFPQYIADSEATRDGGFRYVRPPSRLRDAQDKIVAKRDREIDNPLIAERAEAGKKLAAINQRNREHYKSKSRT